MKSTQYKQKKQTNKRRSCYMKQLFPYEMVYIQLLDLTDWVYLTARWPPFQLWLCMWIIHNERLKWVRMSREAISTWPQPWAGGHRYLLKGEIQLEEERNILSSAWFLLHGHSANVVRKGYRGGTYSINRWIVWPEICHGNGRGQNLNVDYC